MRGEETPTERALRDLADSRLEDPGITVAIFGAGEDSPEYRKRAELCDRLRATNQIAEVIIPEALEVPEGLDLLDVETAVVERSDLVVLLQGPDDLPRGMWTEMVALVNATNWHKFYYVRPERQPKVGSVAVVDRFVTRSLDAVEKWDYQPKWWAACTHITNACKARVRTVVARKRLPAGQ